MTASKSRSRKPPSLVLGIPKERKVHEGRIGMTPEGVRRAVSLGAAVLVEKGAGAISGYPDAAYRAAGARLAGAREIWKRADLVVKIKEPVGPELGWMRPGQALFCYLHLAPNPALTSALLRKRIFSIDYEHVVLADGRAPLLYPMSDVAGHLSLVLGAYYLACHPRGRGVLLGGLSGARTGEVVVIGAGMVGRAAAREASAIGARVVVLDRSRAALARVRRELGPNVEVIRSTASSVARAVSRADLLIGAVYSRGERAPKIVTRRMVREMKPGAVVMDIAIDQGGCVETSRPTTHDDPVYVRDGVIHYAVTNMPGTVPKTSTPALTSATLPYVERLVRHGVAGAVARFPEVARAVNTWEGLLVHPGVRRSLPQLARARGGR